MAYTADDILCRVVMEAASGLPADRFINDFAVQMNSGWDFADLDLLFAAVDQFYNGVGTGPQSVGEYISRSVNRGATHSMEFYLITAPPIGSPIYTKDWLGPEVGSVSDVALPNEVAGVLSFHADLTGIAEESGATRPRARRRGRLYIGPLTAEAISGVSMPKLSDAFTLALREAAYTFAATAPGLWSVWSREDAVLRPVYGGWTDNAPDTQRRRGEDATVRITWSV